MSDKKPGNIYGKSTIDIRKELHQHPEVSEKEAETAERIAGYLQRIPGIQISSGIGGHGIIASKRYGPGKVIGFRAELDALPIDERNEISYVSQNKGVSHVCGHDGHMAMLLDMLEKLEAEQMERGTAVLFFQPAEETGAGADRMIREIEEGAIEIAIPDLCLGIHNIPGRPIGEVCSKNGVFACGSAGLMARIDGKTAHAAHPEAAVNPLILACELLDYGRGLPAHERVSGFALCTPISLHSGSKTFGTSPPDATLRMTLRAAENASLDGMMDMLRSKAEELTMGAGAELDIDFVEHFPPTVNDAHFDQVKDVCHAIGLDSVVLKQPFRWSEDFAHFSRLCPSFMMGLGSGEEQPALHNPDFDFPDELVGLGGKLYLALYKAFTQ